MIKPEKIYYKVAGISNISDYIIDKCRDRIWYTIGFILPNKLLFMKIDQSFNKSALKGLQC
jgi:hypothetical protein